MLLRLAHELIANQSTGNQRTGPPIRAPTATWPTVLPMTALVPAQARADEAALLAGGDRRRTARENKD